MRRLFLNRSEPAKKSGQNIPKNRCRTTIAEQMVETRAELPFIGDQIVCLSHDQAARSADCGIAIARRMVETLAELPFIGDQVVCLSHDQAARSGPAECGREGSLQPTPTWATRL